MALMALITSAAPRGLSPLGHRFGSATGTVPTVPNENNPNPENLPSVDSGGLSPLGHRHKALNPC